MLDKLPWEIQKKILQFDVKHELHKQLKKEILFNKQIKELHLPNPKFETFLKDCVRLSCYSEEEKGIDWYAWMMKKIFDGECPWYYIDAQYSDLIMYLKKMRKLRFAHSKKYGFSMKAWFIRLFLR